MVAANPPTFRCVNLCVVNNYNKKLKMKWCKRNNKYWKTKYNTCCVIDSFIYHPVIFIIVLDECENNNLLGNTKKIATEWPNSWSHSAWAEEAPSPIRGNRTVTTGNTVQSMTHNILATFEILDILSRILVVSVRVAVVDFSLFGCKNTLLSVVDDVLFATTW